TSKISQALAESFGSVEDWRNDFQAIGGMRGGGWGLLCQGPMTQRLTNHWVSLHQDGGPGGVKPLPVMEGGGHAFLRGYRATRRGRYLDAFLRKVDGHRIERRLAEPMAIRPAAAA